MSRSAAVDASPAAAGKAKDRVTLASVPSVTAGWLDEMVMRPSSAGPTGITRVASTAPSSVVRPLNDTTTVVGASTLGGTKVAV